jgi:CBS domain containing-hemolysin-like protein
MSVDSLSILAVGGALDHEFPALNKVLLYLLGIFIFLVLNAVFVAAEFALVKVRKSQLVEAQERRPKRAALALHAVAKLDGYLSAGQLGITVASLALGMLGEPLVASLIAPILLQTPLAETEWAIHVIAFVIAAGSFSFFHVVVGEQVPKVLAIRKPVQMTLWLISPLHWFYRFFGWAIWTINESAGLILRKVFKVEPAGHDEVHSAEELAQLVEESERHDEVTQTEREILINALELNDLKVQDVMTPRSDVVAFEVDDPFEKNLEIAARTKHTRFPLVRGHLDNALGLIHIKDLLTLTKEKDPDLMRIKRDLRMVPETMPLDTLLTFFLREKAHLALVVDEFGDPSGLVFLDNVIEELVGDIQDEFDNERSAFTRVSDSEFIVEGAISLNELSDHVPSLTLESGEVTTVGGYITQQLGYLPEPGDGVEVEGYKAKVTSTDGRRIGQVHFSKLGPSAGGNGTEDSKIEGAA